MGIKDPRNSCGRLKSALQRRRTFRKIKPAVETARKEDINVVRSLPADTVFVRAKGGAYDAVVAMYHDQGHIPHTCRL